MTDEERREFRKLFWGIVVICCAVAASAKWASVYHPERLCHDCIKWVDRPAFPGAQPQ
jgi:hypothetical protein